MLKLDARCHIHHGSVTIPSRLQQASKHTVHHLNSKSPRYGAPQHIYQTKADITMIEMQQKLMDTDGKHKENDVMW